MDGASAGAAAGSEERILTSANASPRSQHKATTLFGLLSKRSTKVEPHPLDANRTSRPGAQARTNNAGSNNASPSRQARNRDTIHCTHDISFARCTTPERIRSANANSRSQTLPATLDGAAVSSSMAASGGNHYTKAKPPKGNASRSASKQRYSGASGVVDGGSQSDGGLTAAVVLRNKTKPKHRSPNHNRFSHQFSLCCKAEKKPLTPPVTVRYNSIPDASNGTLRRDNLSLCWSMADSASVTTTQPGDNSSIGGGGGGGAGGVGGSLCAAGVGQLSMVPLAPLLSFAAAGAVTHAGGIAPTAVDGRVASTECVSAPDSPIAARALHGQLTVLSSPSNSSMKSTQSESTLGARFGNAPCGPIRPIAVTACRSRLRLKLYPPGSVIPPPPHGVNNDRGQNAQISSIRKATTPQHMSSPNIATPRDDGMGMAVDQPSQQGFADGVRFMSAESIPLQRQGSGLARQALMAAQVLSLIPTEKARERSYLDGRLGACSLLGPSELDRVLPRHEVTIFVGTWNMNGQSPPKQMNDFVLPTTISHVPDIVVIGTQESSPDRFDWEATLQETLGPSHVLFHSNTLGTLHLAVYMRRDLIWYCSAPEDASLSVRTGTAFRTKGAVAISFCLFGTSMLFVTSHLTAHQQKVKERVSDVKRIIHALDLPKNLNVRHKNKDVTQNFDNVFWCGDLNFRLGEPREKLLEWIQNTKFPLPSHLPHGYMHTDQLSSVLSDGAAFRGFMEANITFPPTYKYDPGTQHFDTSSKQRAPAYTDRILYKFRQTQGLALRRTSAMSSSGSRSSSSSEPLVQCLMYDSVPSIITSDHKPVWALFKVAVRAGTDSIPLAAGLFNRDIYLEGMKRRLNNQYAGSSAVCAIQ